MLINARINIGNFLKEWHDDVEMLKLVVQVRRILDIDDIHRFLHFLFKSFL